MQKKRHFEAKPRIKGFKCKRNVYLGKGNGAQYGSLECYACCGSALTISDNIKDSEEELVPLSHSSYSL